MLMTVSGDKSKRTQLFMVGILSAANGILAKLVLSGFSPDVELILKMTSPGLPTRRTYISKYDD
jgi:hypothetical protein